MLDDPHDDHDDEDPDGEAPSPDPDRADPVALPIETVLDLHSFQPKEIESVVEEYLAEARRVGFREIRIIHGRGVGVQREIVRKLLQWAPFVLTFQDAPAGWGGWGATIAVLALPGESKP